MFRIRRAFDNVLAKDKIALNEIKKILKLQFPFIQKNELENLSNKLENPFLYKFKTIIFIAEDFNNKVKGFAILNLDPDLKFAYLDYISVNPRNSTGGAGGALYDRVRQEARDLKTIGIFMECLPDDPLLCKDKSVIKQNISRLKFYERYNAFPIINTKYETSFSEKDDCPPYLLFDSLDNKYKLKKETAKKIVKAILERKYGSRCPEGYLEMVLNSFKDNPVKLRAAKYIKKENHESVNWLNMDTRIAIVVNKTHDIHHVKDRGYVEAPVRLDSILNGIKSLKFFDYIDSKIFSEKHLKDVHNSNYVDYFKKLCSTLKPGISVYPYVFPIRNLARPPKELLVRAGYYCIDTFTPLNNNAFIAAKRAVDCALTASELLLKKYKIAYALVRPPGHHAEENAFGGFCYFNSTAIATKHLLAHGRVAILDIDYHHGNGTQQIFYKSKDVLTVSIHGHPSFAYPYFSGFEDEIGEGPGLGFNINFPLPEHIENKTYFNTLKKALMKIIDFNPDFFVVAFGLDIASKDPTGTWSILEKDFFEIGQMIGKLKFPKLIVQEGGYRIRSLGNNARNFFMGLVS